MGKINHEFNFQCLAMICIFRSVSTISGEDTILRIEEKLFEHIVREYPDTLLLDESVPAYNRTRLTAESFSLEADERRMNFTLMLQRELDSIDVPSLSEEMQIRLSILKHHLATFISGYQWRQFGLNPINKFANVIFDHFYWITRMIDNGPVQSPLMKLANYNQKLDTIPRQIDELIIMMNNSIQLGFPSHMLSMKHVISIMSIRWDRIVLRLSNIDLDEDPIATTVLTKLLAIYHKVLELEDFLRYNTRRLEGVASLAGGLKYYHACLKYYTGMDLKVDDIHEYGKQEVERISAQLWKLKQELFLSNDKEMRLYFRNQSRNLLQTKSNIIKEFADLINNQIRPLLFGEYFYFKDINPLRLDLEYLNRYGLLAVYNQNTFFINSEQINSSLYTMVPLALHEAFPGHHFQEHYANISNIPLYRRHLILGRKFAVPFMFPTFIAFEEGWAQYCEILGEEMNLYNSTFNLYGRYQMDIYRACRVVVDTGIHTKGWSKDEALKYMTRYVDFSQEFIQEEIKRIITWPARACTYKIGEALIVKLRHQAETILGDIFNLKEFHDEVLKRGPLSLNILKDIMNHWMEKKQRRQTLDLSCSTSVHNYKILFVTLIFIQFTWCFQL